MKRSHHLAALLCLFLSTAVAKAAEQPNILLIIFDDWSWNHSGAYGCDWINTPNFDRVAAEGVLFENFFTSNPKCAPCRASLLTGRNTWQLGSGAVHMSNFPKEYGVYPTLMAKAGYHVGLTGKGWGPGDFQVAGYEHNPAGKSFDEKKTTPPASGMSNIDYAANFEAFLDAQPSDAPFCHWIGFKEPHRKYELDSGKRLGINLDDIDVPAYFPDTPTTRGDMADYAAEVEYCDGHIGRVLKLLDDRGELDNTLIAITSDHGMPFPFVKGQIHEDGFHLPLVMRWGNTIKPGRRVDDFANIRDLAPTFLEAAHLYRPSTMLGTSLMPILTSPKSGKVTKRADVMITGKERHDLGRPHDWGYPVRAIRTDEWLYVRNHHPERWPAGNPETDYPNCDNSPTKSHIQELGGHYFDLSFGKRPAEELYRLTDDPENVVNLANVPAFSEIKRTLSDEMNSELLREQDPRALGNGNVFDAYPWTGRRTKAYDTWLNKQSLKPDNR